MQRAVLVLCGLLIASPARAELITLRFDVTLTTIHTALSDYFTIGDVGDVTMTYDTEPTPEGILDGFDGYNRQIESMHIALPSYDAEMNIGGNWLLPSAQYAGVRANLAGPFLGTTEYRAMFLSTTLPTLSGPTGIPLFADGPTNIGWKMNFAVPDMMSFGGPGISGRVTNVASVPEPASLLFVLMGGIGLAVSRRMNP